MDVGDLLSNRYELLTKLGVGPLTIAFQARDSVMDRLVTVKILQSEFAAQREVAQRFRQEAQRMADLSHPNLAAVLAVGNGEGIPYLVTEYLSAGSLRKRIDEGSPLAVDKAVDIVLAIAAGVGACHLHGILHGNLRPENVMFTLQESVKTTDGGMGTVLPSTPMDGELYPPHLASYLTPERVTGQPLAPASDVYAMGVIFYEMLTGRPPFSGESSAETALMHLHREVPSLQEQNSAVPAPLVRIIHKMLAKDPRSRYASAQQLHHILLTYKHQSVASNQHTLSNSESVLTSEPQRDSEVLLHLVTSTSDLPLDADKEEEPAEEGVDQMLILLGLLVVAVVLGLILLWTVVYRRYTTPFS